MSYHFDARGAFLPKFLGFVILLFITILISVYVIAKKADPVILDEHGNVRSGGGSHSK